MNGFDIIRRTSWGLLWATLMSSVALGQPSKNMWVTGGHWFDTETASFRPNTGILIQAGEFQAINETEIPDVDSVRRLELTDAHYLLPGLIDLHAHYNVRLLRKRREEFHVMPIQYLANGVTVTFSCGEYDPEGMLQLRTRIENGQQIGPRLINSGPYFGRARPGWHADPEQVRDEVDFWASRGVGGFKAKTIDPECLEALIDQAHKHGLTVTGHLGSGFRNSVNPSMAIDLGIDRIEHFLGGDAMTADRPAYSSLAGIQPHMPEFKQIVQKFVDKQVYFDATITAYGYFSDTGETYEHWFDEPSLLTDFVREQIEARQAQRARRAAERPDRQRQQTGGQFQAIFETKRQTIDDFWRAGGLITLGTDHVCSGSHLPGFGAHREIATMAAAGIPPGEVLKIATINGAKALGIDDRHGSIAVGKVADLAIIEGDPLADIKQTRNMRYVICRGELYEPRQLLKTVQGKLGPASEEEAEAW